MATTSDPTPALPRRVLIANRGEIAVRVARTCRDLGIGTVAVYSDADVDALHVRSCDQAVRIGAAAPAASYLDGEAILAAAERSGADAIHPGYGFLSENAAFAAAVTSAGLTWIGPAAETIAAMGDKLAAKRAMAAAGVPLIPGSDLPAGADLTAVAASIGFPLLVKAAAGGGGKGMRIVTAADDLADAVDAARREAAGAFGDDTVFVERYVATSRHVEVQVLGDATGTVVHAFERECSIQRRHQKVVEEAPSPGIDAEVRAALCAAAVDAATAIGYRNAGTVEFLADETRLAARRAGDDVAPEDCFAFLEVNTRLQVEHPVTEETVRVRRPDGTLDRLDLVREQLYLAVGAPLPFAQADLVQTGHAIEARLYAEDPAAGYLPRSGPLPVLRPAAGPGSRWDTGVVAGEVISTHYDPMIAKVIGSGATRTEAARRLARELDGTALLGVPTNRDLLVAVLRHPAFASGATTTDFLDVHLPDGGVAVPSDAAVRVAVVATTIARVLRDRPRTGVRATVRPGFASAATFVPTVTYDVDGDGDPVRAGWRVDRDGTWKIAIDKADPSAAATVAIDTLGDDPARVLVHAAEVSGDRCHLDVEVDGHRHRIDVDGFSGGYAVATPLGRGVLREHDRLLRTVEEVAPGATLAPMPGAVVTVAVAVGDQVARGDLLCTVEAMKMEHRITAATDGEVVEVHVTPGQRVDADEVLLVVADADLPEQPGL